MTSKLSFKASLLAGLLASGVAAVINSILFFIFHGVGVIKDDIFVQPNQPLTVMPHYARNYWQYFVFCG
jgi:hypothetical protein